MPAADAENPDPQRVTVRPARATAADELEADLARARRLAELLDAKFKIGGIEFGWDSVLGLIPGVGDVATAGLALYPIWLARKHRVGRVTILRMLSNVGVDALVGAVPLAGDVADILFKANRRNLKLFEKAVERQRRRGRT